MAFSPEEMKEFSGFAARLADAARAETLPRFRKGTTIFNKAGPWFDPVTDADREAERALRRMIEKIYPGHGVLGEEFAETKAEGPGSGNWRWVLDPVDGTRAFMCGTTSWATLIALEHDGAPVLGLIDQAFTDERWIGAGGQTFYTHGGETAAAKTSGLTEIAKARISTTDPLATGYFSDEEARAFARVAKAARVDFGHVDVMVLDHCKTGFAQGFGKFFRCIRIGRADGEYGEFCHGSSPVLRAGFKHCYEPAFHTINIHAHRHFVFWSGRIGRTYCLAYAITLHDNF